MRPAIGRIVLYRRHGSPDGTHLPEDSPAIVTKVYDLERDGGDGRPIQVDETGAGIMVDLAVFNPTGMYFNQRTAFDNISENAEPAPGRWRWPPRV